MGGMRDAFVADMVNQLGVALKISLKLNRLGTELKICPAKLNRLRTELKICPAKIFI